MSRAGRGRSGAGGGGAQRSVVVAGEITGASERKFRCRGGGEYPRNSDSAPLEQRAIAKGQRTSTSEPRKAKAKSARSERGQRVEEAGRSFSQDLNGRREDRQTEEPMLIEGSVRANLLKRPPLEGSPGSQRHRRLLAPAARLWTTR
jgi:hypothetical protein